MKPKLYSTAKKLLTEQIPNHRYHLYHKAQAKAILRNLELAKGKTDPKLIKVSDEYAKDVLGWRGYAPWLYVYCAVAGDFKEGWIPDNYYSKVVIPATNGAYRPIGTLNALTSRLFQGNLFPDVAYFVNGLFLGKNYATLDESEVKDILFRNGEVIVYKLDRSFQGMGVFLFDQASFDPKTIRALGNGVFQHYIDQHELFSRYMPSSVATLRITTITDDRGTSSARACYLRIGRSADSHVKSASQVKIPVDLQSGELDAKGYLTTWLTVDKHPDTHIAFAGRRVPNFDNCVTAALDLHRMVPYVRCVGWDMVVDKDNNVKVMEWNAGHCGIKFSEATQGPCFSDLGWERLWQQ